MAISPLLPEVSFHFEPGVGLAAIKRGRFGYSSLARKYPNATEDQARRMNADLGVTEAQAKAMLAGSMFGWHVPAADPETYEIAAKRAAGKL